MEFRGLVTLFGMRTTPGSMNTVWPLKTILVEGFCKPNTDPTEMSEKGKKPSILTVGARALTKHSHWSSEGFWGRNIGSESKKNFEATAKMNQILDECIWINVHTLPHKEFVVEIWIDWGYGMWWTVSGDFRGFLEP